MKQKNLRQRILNSNLIKGIILTFMLNTINVYAKPNTDNNNIDGTNLINKYDSEGNRIEARLDTNDNGKADVIWKYNSKGNIIELQEDYDDDEIMDKIWKYKYWDNGEVCGIWKYGSNKELIEVTYFHDNGSQFKNRKYGQDSTGTKLIEEDGVRK